MNNVGKQIIMLKPVIGVYPVVVDGERPSPDAALVLRCWVSPELPREHIQDLLAHPPAFGERRKCEVVGVHFPEAWNWTTV